MKSDENWEMSRVTILKLEFLPSSPNDPKPIQTKEIGYKMYPAYMHCSTRSPKFSSVSFYDQPFSTYSTCYLIPLTPMVKFQSAIFFCHFWQIAKKVLLNCDENSWRCNVLKIVESEILQSAPNDLKSNSSYRAVKSTLYICPVVPWVPNFFPFALRSAVFEIFYILVFFPIDSHVKFQSATNFQNLADCQEE